jgi:hypothetical protein
MYYELFYKLVYFTIYQIILVAFVSLMAEMMIYGSKADEEDDSKTLVQYDEDAVSFIKARDNSALMKRN